MVKLFQYLIRQPHLPLSDLPFVNTFDGIMTASGAVLYAFEGQVIVLPLENKIKKPQQMLGLTGIISTGMSAVTVIYAICGFLGYVTYGEKVEGSIALNLPEGYIFSIVRGCLALVVFTGFAIQQYIIIEVTLPTTKSFFSKFLDPSQNERRSKIILLIVEFLHRCFLVFICMIVAITVPNLEKIIPLVGIVCGMLLAFVFPAIIDMLVFVSKRVRKFRRSPEEKKLSLGAMITAIVLKDIFLIILGIFGLVAGLQASIKNLIE